MARKTLADLSATTTVNDTDLLHIRQGSQDYKITAKNLIDKSVQDTQRITTDTDFAVLTRDTRIYADTSSSDVTVGLFNGATNDGDFVDVICIGSNVANIELSADGTTDYALNDGDRLKIAWDDTAGAWVVISLNRNYDLTLEISDQISFNSVIERVAANQYKFIDSVESVYFRSLSGGYQISEILSGGDTWGYIQTNNAIRVICEKETVLDFGSLNGYFEINTDYCVVDGLRIIGDGTTVTGLSYCFSIANGTKYATYKNCTAYNRDSSDPSFAGFRNNNALGGINYDDNLTSFFINCVSDNIPSYGFYTSSNLIGCKAISCESGFVDCWALSGCSTITNTTAGFLNCDEVSSCESKSDVSSGFSGCSRVSSSRAYGSDTGFAGCTEISGCYALSNTTYNYNACRDVSGCQSSGSTVGFYQCKNLSSCIAINASSHGYQSCLRVASCQSGLFEIMINSGNGGDGFNDCDQVNSCFAEYNGAYGFNGCNSIGHNLAQNNVTAGYNNSFADYGGTVSVHTAGTGNDNAASGWNA